MKDRFGRSAVAYENEPATYSKETLPDHSCTVTRGRRVRGNDAHTEPEVVVAVPAVVPVADCGAQVLG